jgi:endonuclease/exonuclease/phosphatase family metal-dependent hydrolase
VTWNIERGYELPKIIALLRAVDADIIALQEIDSGCSRSQFVDTGIAIARELQLNYLFQTEFIELESGDRSQPTYRDGVHGNGILTKFDFSTWSSIDHACQPFNWPRDGALINEPRKGRRFTLCAHVRVPAVYKLQYLSGLRASDLSPSSPTAVAPIHCIVAVYTCHMELFCGMSHRLQVLQELFQHASALATPYQLLLGDFNTLAHSLARFSSRYCRDGLRWRTLGWTEAEWWASHALDYGPDDALEHAMRQGGEAGEVLQRLLSSRSGDTDAQLAPEEEASLVARLGPLLRNPHLQGAGAEALVNPGFSEAFASDTETLRNYRGWFHGKLDFLLSRGLCAVDRQLYNRDYSASDHRLLWVAGFLDDRHTHPRGALYARLRGLPVAEDGEGAPADDAVAKYEGDDITVLLPPSRSAAYHPPASPVPADDPGCDACGGRLQGEEAGAAPGCPRHGWLRNCHGDVAEVRPVRSRAGKAGCEVSFTALRCRVHGHRDRNAGPRALVKRLLTPWVRRAATGVLLAWLAVAVAFWSVRE